MIKEKKKKLSIKPKEQKQPYQILHTLYYKPTYNKRVHEEFDVDSDINDFICTIYRDEETGEKRLDIQPNPKFQFFVANDDVEIDLDAPSQIELDKVHIEQVEYKNLLRYINQLKNEYEGTNVDFTKTYCKDGKSYKPTYEANQLHFFNRLFASDMDIEDYWKGKFIERFPNAKKNKLTKSFTDIEVDSIDIVGFPDEEFALCPVNAITTFIEESMTFYTLLLYNEDIPECKKIRENKEKFIKKLKKEFGKEYNFKLFWFSDEMTLIQQYFNLINKTKPDFNLIYNMKFDINYLLNRIGELNGMDINKRQVTDMFKFRELCADIICPDDFPDFLKVAYYIPDKRHDKASDKIDEFHVASYTQWLDQMCLYASLRKQKELESYSLSFVSQKELKNDKLNYSESGYNIKTLPYDDYAMFIRYNIKDVLLQYLLEKKNNDVDLLYSIADITKTRINKAMRKTVSLKNMKHYFDLEQGYVQGNNHNLNFGNTTRVTEQFSGAWVAPPELNDYNGTIINGIHSKYIYDFIIDFDYSALYPSIIRTFNIDVETQYGRLQFLGETTTKEYDSGGIFIDELESNNIILLATKYLSAPSISDVISRCKQENLI